MADYKRIIKFLLGKNKMYVKLRDRYTDYRVSTYKGLSDREFVKRDFKHVFGYNFDYDNPKGYHEVMAWYKDTDYLGSLGDYVDKLKVRDYVAQKIGEEHLIPLYDVWHSKEDINLDKLPETYVLMPNHLSGSYFIQDGMAEVDGDKLTKKLHKWFDSNYYDLTREPQYKYIEPKVLVLKYMKDSTGDLTDFKYMMINGEIEFILGIYNRRTKVKYSKTGPDWEMTKHDKILFENPVYRKFFHQADRPEVYKEMEEIVCKLAEGFPFLRVDIYVVDNHVYFGELTFTSGDSKVKMPPEDYNVEVGDKIYAALTDHIKGLQ